MAKVTVNAGICNFVAVFNAIRNEETEMVEVDFKTTCPNFKHLEENVIELDPLVVCFEKIGTGQIFELFRDKCPHNACPIPTAMIKAVEVAEGLALPKDVTMKIEK